MGRPRDLRTAAERARHPVVKDPAKTLEIGRRYIAGANIKQLAVVFGCGHETIRKILHLQGIQMRGTGPVLGSRAAVTWHRSSGLCGCAIDDGKREQRVWCRQCERNVLPAEAKRCSSQFCKGNHPHTQLVASSLFSRFH
jgi:hypothetical protein